MNAFRAKLKHLFFHSWQLFTTLLDTLLSSAVLHRERPRFSSQNNSPYRWYLINHLTGDMSLLTSILHFTVVSCSFSSLPCRPFLHPRNHAALELQPIRGTSQTDRLLKLFTHGSMKILDELGLCYGVNHSRDRTHEVGYAEVSVSVTSLPEVM